jgi:hypothetical protein
LVAPLVHGNDVTNIVHGEPICLILNGSGDNYDGSMERLRQLLRCPRTWYDDSGEDWVTTIMELDWYYSLAQHAIDGDDLPFQPWEFDMFAGEEDASEREHLEKNLQMRRPEAEKTFLSRAGRLIGLRFMRPSEQRKHFDPNWTQQQSISRSISEISYLFQDFESARLERCFWACLHYTFMDQLREPQDYEEFVTPGGELAGLPEATLWRSFLTTESFRFCIDTRLRSFSAAPR